jgi:hypothetical protein
MVIAKSRFEERQQIVRIARCGVKKGGAVNHVPTRYRATRPSSREASHPRGQQMRITPPDAPHFIVQNHHTVVLTKVTHKI